MDLWGDFKSCRADVDAAAVTTGGGGGSGMWTTDPLFLDDDDFNICRDVTFVEEIEDFWYFFRPNRDMVGVLEPTENSDFRFLSGGSASMSECDLGLMTYLLLPGPAQPSSILATSMLNKMAAHHTVTMVTRDA